MASALKPRRDADATRERILVAAQAAFAARGYDHVGIREIAAQAGVSSTILLRYYGTKAGLFEAALIASVRLERVLAVDRARFGDHLAELFARRELDVRPPVLIGITSGDPQASAITARITESHMVAPMAEWLGGREPRARAIEIAMLATGFVIYARQLGIAAASEPALSRWFAEAVQAVVDAG